MKITEVRMKVVAPVKEHRVKLLAYASITIDNCFVVHELKLMQKEEVLFVSMPSRKRTDKCPQCDAKNWICSGFCSSCGGNLNPERTPPDAAFYQDVAHPISWECREVIEQALIDEYNRHTEVKEVGTNLDPP